MLVMLRFLCKTLVITKAKDCTSSHALFHRTTSSTESISGNLGSIEKKNLTISYLMNSCGLPFKAATLVAQKIHIEATERPDSVIEFLQTVGFTNTQIANLITKCPRLLFANPIKTLKPKIEFFQSLGFSTSDLAKFLSSDQTILGRSLQKQIILTFNFLKNFIHTNENLITVLMQSSRIVGCNIKRILEPNIATLQSYGVPDSDISKIMISQPRLLTPTSYRFKDVAATLNGMGFDPNSRTFILAIRSMAGMTKQNWDGKRETFRSFGWSDQEFLLAFKVQPMIMVTSEKKLGKMMHFFVKVLHLKPSDVVRCPNLFLLSLERRIIPRCSVLQLLMSRGLIEKDVNILSALDNNKRCFEKRFVTKYQGEVPEVIKAYQGEIGFPGFDT